MISFTEDEWKMLKAILYEIAWGEPELQTKIDKFVFKVETRIEKAREE